MEVIIERVGSRDAGCGANDSAEYIVRENGREYRIACRTQAYPRGRSFCLAGKEGFLYIDAEDNKVHMQAVALGGGCGLRIDDEVVEGLSPSALRQLIAVLDRDAENQGDNKLNSSID